MKQLTIGLAGHIDHGKTSIVKFLTGKNTDNLKEEIKRGMTIDIGFAHLNKKISLIDVPGHEKFIKNMVSGVSSIDFAIFPLHLRGGGSRQVKRGSNPWEEGSSVIPPGKSLSCMCNQVNFHAFLLFHGVCVGLEHMTSCF